MVLPELAHIQELNEMPKYKEKSKQFVIDKSQKGYLRIHSQSR